MKICVFLKIFAILANVDFNLKKLIYLIKEYGPYGPQGPWTMGPMGPRGLGPKLK